MIQIALTWSKEGATELESLGFTKVEVYVRHFHILGAPSSEVKAAGDSQFFSMTNVPFQFVTTDFWGRGVD